MINIEFQFEPSDGRCIPGVKALAQSSAALGRMFLTAPYMVLTDEDGALHDLLKQIVLNADSTRVESERICSLMATQIMLLMARLWQKSRLPARFQAHVAEALGIAEAIRERAYGAGYRAAAYPPDLPA